MHPEVTAAEPGTCPQCGMKLVAVPAGPTSYACPMHPEVTAAEPGTCPQCGMKLVPADAPPPPAAEPGQDAAHGGHDHGDGLEWEDLMPEINRASDSGNMIWQLIDRETGAVNGDINWSFTVGDRVKIRLVNEMDSDHPMHHPFHVHGAGRFLILSRDGEPEPNLVWKDTVLVRAGETVDILLDVSNPGLWMAHCHIAEHNESGMMFSFNVARTRSRSDEPRVSGRAPGRARDRRRPGRPGHGLPPDAARTAFEIVDAGAEIGHVWRSRWDSLRLFTSGRYDNLPGLPFPAAPDAYPGKDDVADYLQAYAAKFKLPVRLNTTVTSLTRSDGTYVAKAGEEALEARQVVVATGPFQVPFIPPVADGLDPDVYQVHSADYRHPQTSRPDGSWWSAPRTRAARSPGNSRRPTAWNSPSASGSRRSLSGRWAATCGPGRPRCGWTGSPRTHGWEDAWPGGTR